MAAREITLQLPEDIYQQLTKVAQRSHQSVNEIAVQSLQVGLSQNLYHPLEGGYDIQLTRTWTISCKRILLPNNTSHACLH